MPSLNTGNAILSNPIKVDSSYNVGIGGAASGSFKLQVTGTTNLTGALSGTSAGFTSSITASNYIANTGSTNTTSYLLNRGSSSYDGILEWQDAGSSRWKVGTFGTGSGDLRFYSAATGGYPLTLNYGSGAATFSGSVSAGTTTINGNGTVGSLIIKALAANEDIAIEYKTSANVRRGYIGYGALSSSLFEISNNENGAIDFRTNSAFAARITSGGNLLIGTTTDSSYKLSVFNGMQYLGTGFVINNDFTSTGRQAATGVSDFGGTTVTFDLAAIFPRVTFLNRGLSVTMQLVALPTYTIVSSAFVVLGRTGNSNQWTNTILANLNIAGAGINSVTATGTVITVNYSTYIFGTAYINLATIG